jgi:hypothetical protein
MQPGTENTEKLLSSGMTTFWRDFFPPVWTIAVGAGMLGIWLEAFGEPASLGLKLLGGALWAGTSILFSLGTRRLRHVWLRGSDLIVSSSGRRVTVPLQDVIEVSETRYQKIKTIKLVLRQGSPLGSEIRFIPPPGFQAPFTEHPVIGELRERKRQLPASNG